MDSSRSQSTSHNNGAKEYKFTCQVNLSDNSKRSNDEKEMEPARKVSNDSCNSSFNININPQDLLDKKYSINSIVEQINQKLDNKGGFTINFNFENNNNPKHISKYRVQGTLELTREIPNNNFEEKYTKQLNKSNYKESTGYKKEIPKSNIYEENLKNAAAAYTLHKSSNDNFASSYTEQPKKFTETNHCHYTTYEKPLYVNNEINAPTRKCIETNHCHTTYEKPEIINNGIYMPRQDSQSRLRAPEQLVFTSSPSFLKKKYADSEVGSDIQPIVYKKVEPTQKPVYYVLSNKTPEKESDCQAACCLWSSSKKTSNSTGYHLKIVPDDDFENIILVPLYPLNSNLIPHFKLKKNN